MTRQLRRFNYTDRLKIPASDVDMTVRILDDGKVEAVLNALNLPEPGRHTLSEWNAANVILEARRLSTGSFDRSKIGTISALRDLPPPIAIVPLKDFPDAEDITFRIKIVSGDKKLFADGDRIRPGQSQSDKEPLIEVYLQDLGEELWRISWQEEELGPRVLVNKRRLTRT